MPRKPINLPPDIWRKAQSFFREIADQGNVLPDPDPVAVRARMQELRDMGFEDLPTYQGLSSSVRQYAWNSLIAQQQLHDKCVCFLTLDPVLLERADELEKRFGLRPKSPRDLIEPSWLATGQAGPILPHYLRSGLS